MTFYHKNSILEVQSRCQTWMLFLWVGIMICKWEAISCFVLVISCGIGHYMRLSHSKERHRQSVCNLCPWIKKDHAGLRQCWGNWGWLESNCIENQKSDLVFIWWTKGCEERVVVKQQESSLRRWNALPVQWQ